MKSRLFLLTLAAAAAGCFSGCASSNLVRVKPWERATLAGYPMRPDRDPLSTAMAEHIFFSREAAFKDLTETRLFYSHRQSEMRVIER